MPHTPRRLPFRDFVPHTLLLAAAFAALVPIGMARQTMASSVGWQGAGAQDAAGGRWSDELIGAALAADSDKLSKLLTQAPSAIEDEELARVRLRVQSLQKHLDKEAADNSAALESRRKDLATHLGEKDLLKALVDAANLHELASEVEWQGIAASPDIVALLGATRAALNEAGAAGDLLYAQDLTFRMKAIAEDIGDKALEKEMEAALREQSARLSLIARYAPRAFYDMRVAMIRRIDPDQKVDPYNDLFAEEWKEAVHDASPSLLLKSLQTAANSHITDSGWQPLIEGGIDSLRILATSEQLAEKFPNLADPQRVAAFTSALDRMAARRGTSFADARDVLVEVTTVNDRTIGLPVEVLVTEFGDGATANLSEDYGDDYSSIIWPDQLRRFRQQMDGDFVGVGVLIRYDDRREIMVVNPLEGSPAARAGVRPGDRIVKVDGESTAGWSLNKAVDSITGPAGKAVTIELRREDTEEPVTVSLIRQSIPMQSVHGWWKRSLDEGGSPVWDWYIDPEAGIGYTRVSGFNDDTVRDFVHAVDAMKAERPLRGLIIDLRGNPGGLLPAAAGFVNLFVSRGPLVSIEDRNGNKVDQLSASAARARFAGLPLVVLVNGESASASEIVSGALQAYDAATVVGSRSFGKGSVQTVQPVTDGRTMGAVKVTTQYYVLPPEPGATEGRWVHKRAGRDEWGVEPDVEVPLTAERARGALELRGRADFIDAGAMDLATVDLRPDVDDLVREGVDRQLEMAVLLLETRLLAEQGSSRVAIHTPAER